MSLRLPPRPARRTTSHSVLVVGVLFALARPLDAQRVRFPANPANPADSAALTRAMPAFAKEVLAQYREPDLRRGLDDRFRLQIVAGLYDEAARTAAELRALRTRGGAPLDQAGAATVHDEIWARAMAASSATGQPFDVTFARAFRSTFAAIDDRTATLVIRVLAVGPRGIENAFRRALEQRRTSADMSLADAVSLLRSYQRVLTHGRVAQALASLLAEDDLRRYVIQRKVKVPTPDGGTVCALLVRPRSSARRLPALLTFTIYVDSAANVSDARRAASNGYVGVVGFTRGKACSPDVPVPYRTDGRDAATLIDWIAAQPWSDRRVGMYGGSYNGFTTWATTKYMPKALKAIMVGAPVAPGLDVPMEGNIVPNFIYPWPLYTTDNKTLDDTTYFNNARWNRLYRTWYVTGKAYRDLPAIDETPNPVFMEWLAHPAYDSYWQAMIPYRDEFAKVNIPVLQTAGYYFGGPGAAMHYLTQHYTYDPAARHYLVIGPYDHPQGQRGVVDALGDTATIFAGYEIDPAARIDIVADLRYQWFDWVLRGGPRPALLRDRVNYEVMGLDTWKHAPSIAAMSNGTLRLYLQAAGSRALHRLSPQRTAPDSFVPFRVDLTRRTDVDSTFPGGGVRDTALNTYEAVTFVSDPLDGMELSGLYSGHLTFVTNKRDFDLSVALFELTPHGDYIQLPPFQVRVSYAHDATTRRLLEPGARETLDFRANRLMSRKLERGSRIVAVIGPIKAPVYQINYGSGKNVSDETIADAGEPLEIRWFGDSYLELPTRR